MARTGTRNLTEGNPMRLLLSFAVPILFGFLFQQLYNFVDTAIVGKTLGAAKLAAVGGTGSINFLVLGFCQGSCTGFAIPIARAFGAGDERDVRKYTANSVYLSAGLAVVMATLTGIFCPQMLRLMNTPEEIIDSSVSYIRIIFLGIPATVLYNMAGGILRSLGDSKTPVVMLVIASLVNVALDLLLILVVHMDVAGAAVATVISQLVAGMGCLWVMKRNFPILRISGEERVFEKRHAGELLSVGLPMGLQFSITAVGSVLIQWSVNGLGVAAVAGVAAGVKLNSLFYTMFDALASAMATFSGQNLGARKPGRIKEGLRDCSVIGIIYCIVVFGVIMLFGKNLLSLFVDGGTDPEVLANAFRFTSINSAFFIPLLFVNILRLTIQGMGFTKVAMLAGVFEMIARGTVAIFVVPALGFTGVCLGNPAAWVLATIFLFPCCARKYKEACLKVGVPLRETGSAES